MKFTIPIYTQKYANDPGQKVYSLFMILFCLTLSIDIIL